MRQFTLVAWYGAKPALFEELIRKAQGILSESIPSFAPYEIAQVHATILGLERLPATDWHNANFARHRGQFVPMNVAGFLRWLREGDFPFTVQIGGFTRDELPFTSRGASPYQRSFSIAGDKAVMMGWPVERSDDHGSAANYPLTLESLRRGGQQFGMLHSFHASSGDVDNDFFFRLGMIHQPEALEPGLRRETEERLRQFLSERPALFLGVNESDVVLAVYEDNRLPTGTTRVLPLRDVQLNEESIRALLD